MFSGGGRKTKTVSTEWSGTPRSLKRWVGEIQASRTKSPMGVIPVSSSPPTIIQGDYEGVSAVSSIANGGSGYIVGDEVTITGGTAVVAAILRVASVSGGAITSATVIRGGIYSVNASNPISQGSTTGSGVDATFNLTFSARGASDIRNRRAGGHTDDNIKWNAVEPRSTVVGGDYVGSSAYIGTGSSLEFDTDSQYINTHILPFNGGFNVLVDGERISEEQYTAPSSTTPFISLAFATTGVRRIKFIGTNLAISNIYISNEADIWFPPEPSTVQAYVLGDSYTHGTGATDGSGTEWATVMGRVLGWDVLPVGIGSTGYLSTSPNTMTERINNDLLARTITPDVVVIALGYNDSAGNQTTIGENALAAYELIKEELPDALVFVLGPWTPLGATVNSSATAVTIEEAVDEANTTGKFTFIPVSDIVNAVNKSIYTAVDNVHPTPLGHLYLGVRIGQLIKATFV